MSDKSRKDLPMPLVQIGKRPLLLRLPNRLKGTLGNIPQFSLLIGSKVVEQIPSPGEEIAIDSRATEIKGSRTSIIHVATGVVTDDPRILLTQNVSPAVDLELPWNIRIPRLERLRRPVTRHAREQNDEQTHRACMQAQRYCLSGRPTDESPKRSLPSSPRESPSPAR